MYGLESFGRLLGMNLVFLKSQAIFQLARVMSIPVFVGVMSLGDIPTQPACESLSAVHKLVARMPTLLHDNTLILLA